MRKPKKVPPSEPDPPVEKKQPNRFGILISGFEVAPSVHKKWTELTDSKGGRPAVKAALLEEAVIDLLTKNGKWGLTEIATYAEEQRNRPKRGPAKK